MYHFKYAVQNKTLDEYFTLGFHYDLQAFTGLGWGLIVGAYRLQGILLFKENTDLSKWTDYFEPYNQMGYRVSYNLMQNHLAYGVVSSDAFDSLRYAAGPIVNQMEMIGLSEQLRHSGIVPGPRENISNSERNHIVNESTILRHQYGYIRVTEDT